MSEDFDTQDLMIEAVEAALETDNSPGVLLLKRRIEQAYEVVRSLRNEIHNLTIDNFNLKKELGKRKKDRR